jgi:type II secretory pathway predicted ATPase ExeA
VYENHYRVQDDPFRLTPDNNAAYEHSNYLSGKAFLQHIIADSEKSVVVISGVAGVGKSTLVNSILQQQKGSNIRCCLLQSSQINAHGFLHSITSVLDLDSNNDDEVTIQQLDEYLAQRTEQNQCSVLVIDDAHELSATAFNKLGQLARIILDNQYLAKIFLVGNEQLSHLLQSENIDAQHTSVTTGWNLDGLTADEVKPYVLHRLVNAGGAGLLKIEDNAWDTIYRFSDGIPRRINRICSKLLIDGLFENKLVFTKEDVTEAITHLDKEGLLELNSNLASQHGLVGTNRSHQNPREQVSVNAFLSGFADTGPNTGQIEGDIEGISLNIKIAANDLPADAEDDLTVHANMQENETLSEPPIMTNDTNEANIESEESDEKKGRVVLVILLLISFVIVIVYGDFFTKNTDDSGADTSPLQAKSDKAEADADRSALLQQATDQSGTSGQSVDNIADEEISASGTASRIAADEPVITGDITTQHGETAALKTESMREAEESVTDQEITAEQIKPEDHVARQAMDEEAPVADAAQRVDEASSQESSGEFAEPKDITLSTEAKQQSETSGTNITSGDQKDPEQMAAHEQADAILSEGIPQASTGPVKQKQALPGFTREQLKSMLLAGFWYRNGSPALLLPSELNKCTDNGPDIFCLSKGRETPSDSGPLMQRQHTGAMIEGFEANGTFNVLYRSTKAGTDIADQQPGASTNLLKGLAGIQEQQMSCRFENASVILCIKEGVRMSYMRRFKSE